MLDAASPPDLDLLHPLITPPPLSATASVSPNLEDVILLQGSPGLDVMPTVGEDRSPASSRTTLHGYTASLNTNFVIRGSTMDSTVVGGVLYWEGTLHYILLFRIPHSVEKP
jgi:hypothetical protein